MIPETKVALRARSSEEDSIILLRESLLEGVSQKDLIGHSTMNEEILVLQNALRCFSNGISGPLVKYTGESVFFKCIDNAYYDKSGEVLLLYNNGSKEEFIIPNGVKKIAPRAFAGNDDLNKIVLPSSLIEIGVRAFACCFSLKNVVMLNSNNETNGELLVDDKAFYSCYKLKEVCLNNAKLMLGTQAFESCELLSKIDCKSMVACEHCTNAFMNCSKLESVCVDAEDADTFIKQYIAKINEEDDLISNLRCDGPTSASSVLEVSANGTIC